MGLDMYLYKKTYISSSEWINEEKRDSIEITQGGKPHPKIKAERIKYVIEDVGYWRKANAIHKWFVDNVQKGVDDCGEYFVAPSQLVKLKELCVEILENKHKGSELLPTESGFFFGTTDYDDWYFGSLIETIQIIDEVLSDDDAEYYYHSSW